MQLKIPDFALVVLIGASGSGKSTFAARHFLATEVLSSDRSRGWVSDDETDQSATKDAFEILHFIAAKRLAARRLTVIDATNVRAEDRKHLVLLARKYHALPVAIAFDLPEEICIARNGARSDRQFGPQVVRNHTRLLRKSLRGLSREGFRHVHVLSSLEEVEAATIQREPLYTDRRSDHGPFDIIGDVHGCLDELHDLLAKLDYAQIAWNGETVFAHPAGRRAIFLGDLVDRGPNSPGVLALTMRMIAAGTALCVQGNHEARLVRKLNGRDVKLSHGLQATLDQFERLPESERTSTVAAATSFMDELRSHYWLDDGRLVVAHAGLKEEMHGRGSGAVRSFALFGETTGETDEYGLPVRYDWAEQYRGKAAVVYGHVPTTAAEWVNRTICIDTGCVFGGRLTALRYPEMTLVDVPAHKVHFEPTKPLRSAPSNATAQQQADSLLDIADISGKRTIATRLMGYVKVEAENAAAALEIASRYCVDPRWMIYLPPTMSPSETSAREGLLEHPEDAFGYFLRAGVQTVIAEEKHMGSRAVAVVARDHGAARRFDVGDGRAGRIYTRTGRPFFNDNALEAAVLGRLAATATAVGMWDELQTDWVCLDVEIMPWSFKAASLIERQYAPVGAAGRAATRAVADVVQAAIARGIPAEPLAVRLAARCANVEAYIGALQHYVRPAVGIDDLQIAPFHILATEGRTYFDRTHVWHMQMLEKLCAGAPGWLRHTPYRKIETGDDVSKSAAIAWWEESTAAGGEGMVIKPLDCITQRGTRLIQPALKCRGREYLRIIYGPDYTLPEHIERLRARGLNAKRALALREFAMGVEGLERFVAREPLRRVHECVFGVLALESEPVDPRL